MTLEILDNNFRAALALWPYDLRTGEVARVIDAFHRERARGLFYAADACCRQLVCMAQARDTPFVEVEGGCNAE